MTRSQVLGIALAVATAVGCVAYERLVKAHRLSAIFALAVAFYVLALILCCVLDWRGTLLDLRQLAQRASVWLLSKT